MAPTQRSSWKLYFMKIASQVGTRSTCDRNHIGAVIVRDKTILSTGYNGSIRGLSHCDEEDHMIENGHCVRFSLQPHPVGLVSNFWQTLV